MDEGDGAAYADFVRWALLIAVSPAPTLVTAGLCAEINPIRTVEYQESLVASPADQGNAATASDIESHFGRAGTRNEHRNPHLDDFDHHFRSEAASRVEQFVAAGLAFHPHQPRNRVHRIMTADVLDVMQNVTSVGEYATMQGAGTLVDRVEGSHSMDQREQGRTRHAEAVVLQRRRAFELVAELRALAATGSYGAPTPTSSCRRRNTLHKAWHPSCRGSRRRSAPFLQGLHVSQESAMSQFDPALMDVLDGTSTCGSKCLHARSRKN